jgi:pilus assembly protein CpaC
MFTKLIRTLLSCSVGVCFTPMAQAPMSAAEGADGAAVTAVQTHTASNVLEGRPAAARDLFVTVGKSLVVDSPVNIQRVSVANGEFAEALAVNPREVLVNGKAAGETSMIIWQQGGNRLFFDLTVRPSNSKVGVVQQQIDRELPGQEIKISFENDTAFLHGTAKDLTSAERAVAMAATLGKTVNLLRVNVPPTDAQILLKVRFADVDRAATVDLGLNLFSTGATNTIGGISTGAFSAPQVKPDASGTTITLADALNIFLFRPDINLGATIKDLESKRLLQILAEPNVLAINGKQASFLAGGEFPFPMLQGGGGGLGAVTIQFRGWRTHQLHSDNHAARNYPAAGDAGSQLARLCERPGIQGVSIPALSTRRVKRRSSSKTGRVLDRRLAGQPLTETLNRIPLASIPCWKTLPIAPTARTIQNCW